MCPTPPAEASWLVGTWDGRRFAPERQGRLDHGGSFYAPQALLDARGRRIAFGWLREERSADDQRASGWSGVMSLPRVRALGAGGELRSAPAEEVATLRRVALADFDRVALGPGPPVLVPETAPQLELAARPRLRHPLRAPGGTRTWRDVRTRSELEGRSCSACGRGVTAASRARTVPGRQFEYERP